MRELTKKILFVSHDSQRTGAPIVLLNLADLLNNHYKIDFLLRNSGPLEMEFISRGKTVIATRNLPLPLLTRLKNKMFGLSKFNFKNIVWTEYDFIISNTITTGDLLTEIRKNFSGPIFSYIHELEMGIKFYTSPAGVTEVLKYSNGYLTASEGIKNHFKKTYLLSENNIISIPSYIPPFATSELNVCKTVRDFRVGAVGTIDWRKGAEIFILIAKSVFQKRPESQINFVWKGGATELELDRLNYDISKFGLNGKVSFIAPSGNMAAFYSEIDLFLLTSREDPYPLVVLEAADMSIPSICFEDAGGAQEFIQASKGGSVIPYLDISASADEVLIYYDDPEYLMNTGLNAKKWLSATHQNAEYVGKKFNNAVALLLANINAPN